MTTVDLGCRLDLLYIASNAYNVIYNPKVFNGLTMMLKNPQSSANIFGSGKMVCLGTVDEESARIATRRFARIIQKVGLPIRFIGYRIANIVGSTELGFRLNFHKFYNDNKDRVYYNPESFPGIYYSNGKATVTLFKSGKVTMTGLKSRQQMYEVYEELYPKALRSRM